MKIKQKGVSKRVTKKAKKLLPFPKGARLVRITGHIATKTQNRFTIEKTIQENLFEGE